MVEHIKIVYTILVKGAGTMAISEAQKKASAKYHKENIASLACRVRKEQADKFKVYCQSIGKTSNAVLREYVLECINETPSIEEATE